MSARTCPDWPALMERAPDLQFKHYAEVEARLFAAAPGARFVLARLEETLPQGDEVLLDLPISIYGGG